MAVIDRPTLIAFAAAGAVALVIPIALLLPGKAGKTPSQAPAPIPIAAAAPPPLAAVYQRQLFGTAAAAAEAEAETPADAPSLIGIVGRLGDDAVAMVRTAEGSTRTLKIGDSVDGWTLASLAIDAAFFTRGAERVRVPLPLG